MARYAEDARYDPADRSLLVSRLDSGNLLMVGPSSYCQLLTYNRKCQIYSNEEEEP